MYAIIVRDIGKILAELPTYAEAEARRQKWVEDEALAMGWDCEYNEDFYEVVNLEEDVDALAKDITE